MDSCAGFLCWAVRLSNHSSTLFRRGLVIDTKRGNILSLDRHKYVRRAVHGLREVESETRKSTYANLVATFTESNYVNIDTIFLLIGTYLCVGMLVFRWNSFKDAAADRLSMCGEVNCVKE